MERGRPDRLAAVLSAAHYAAGACARCSAARWVDHYLCLAPSRLGFLQPRGARRRLLPRQLADAAPLPSADPFAYLVARGRGTVLSRLAGVAVRDVAFPSEAANDSGNGGYRHRRLLRLAQSALRPAHRGLARAQQSGDATLHGP